MAVQRTREEEEARLLTALENDAYITGAVAAQMQRALDRINGIEKENEKKKNSSNTKKRL